MQKIKSTLLFMSLIILIGLAGYLTYYRFTNPDLTETRILFNTWPVSVGVLASITVMIICLRKDK